MDTDNDSDMYKLYRSWSNSSVYSYSYSRIYCIIKPCSGLVSRFMLQFLHNITALLCWWYHARYGIAIGIREFLQQLGRLSICFISRWGCAPTFQGYPQNRNRRKYTVCKFVIWNQHRWMISPLIHFYLATHSCKRGKLRLQFSSSVLQFSVLYRNIQSK